VQRYEWERPGDLIHVDVKTLARFREVGHRITGDLQQGRSYGVGYDWPMSPSKTPPGWPISQFD
jgi:hypothetical protein